jgi:hypothetical protein
MARMKTAIMMMVMIHPSLTKAIHVQTQMTLLMFLPLLDKMDVLIPVHLLMTIMVKVTFPKAV